MRLCVLLSRPGRGSRRYPVQRAELFDDFQQTGDLGMILYDRRHNDGSLRSGTIEVYHTLWTASIRQCLGASGDGQQLAMPV